MEKLTTIQKHEKLNEVWRLDQPGPGGAHHDYAITTAKEQYVLEYINFQNGPRKELDSRHGILDSDLLEIVRDRLKAFQAGPFACEENARALQHIEEALFQMNLRVENRIARGVLGTMEK